MKLLNIGFGNMVSAERLIAVVSPDSAPIKRLIQESRERGMLIDASYGRSTRAVLIMDSDHVVLSALQPETVANRAAGQESKGTTEEEQTHCEMIKEAVKGIFINESRTAAEAEFIKTHIVDYEKIFDVCMNGDDLEFKKGLVRLQRMQNECVMQREND